MLATEVNGNNKSYCTPEINPNYHAVYNTGWVKHDFKALRNSDRARFQLACDDVVQHDFIQDYLREDQAAPGGWASDAAGDGEVIVAGPEESRSSLEYNLEDSTFDTEGTDLDPSRRGQTRMARPATTRCLRRGGTSTISRRC